MVFYTDDNKDKNLWTYTEEQLSLGFERISKEEADTFFRSMSKYNIKALKEFLEKSLHINTIYCFDEKDLLNAVNVEILMQKDYAVYYSNRLWKLDYIGTHEEEKELHKMLADLSSKYADVLVAPNHNKYPTHWAYYKA